MARRRFTVREYERMGEVGIVTEDDRVELIAGEIFDMAAISVGHAQGVNRLARLLIRALPDTIQVSAQNPVRLSDNTEPQPDLAALHDRAYDATPSPPDILFVIEVSDTTRDYDRGTKIPLYASAGIAEAWLVALVAETIERYTDPQNGHYRLVAIAHRGETLASTVFPALVIDVDRVLATAA